MAPGIPTKLSADAINETTVILTWTAPSDVGTGITGYRISRRLNGGSFANIINNSAPSVLTTYTDDDGGTGRTLIARDYAEYKVAAIDTTTGSDSTIASTTTATSEAQSIAELLFDEWSLTGELAKTASSTMTEAVNFFDRGQIPGNKVAKAVTVQKINALGNEIIVEHPKFFEESEIFEVTCFLQVIDAAKDQFSVWIDLMQQMTSEVTRILRTVYAPSSAIGAFFRTNSDWTKDDTFFPDDPLLVRTLKFRLTKIKSNDIEVFTGNGGVLTFDTSASSADSKPASDYIYAQVTDIFSEEGYPQIPYLTKDVTNGVGVPFMARGMYNGKFTANMFVKSSDFDVSTINALDNIFLPQSNSPNQKQLATVVLLQANKTASTSTSSTASGTASVTSSTLTGVSVDFGGTGYDNKQRVNYTSLDSTGTGGSGIATVVSGTILTVTVDEDGENYLNDETVTIIGVASSETLTQTGTMKIDRLSIISKDEDLLKCKISGVLTKVTGFVVS